MKYIHDISDITFNPSMPCPLHTEYAFSSLCRKMSPLHAAQDALHNGNHKDQGCGIPPAKDSTATCSHFGLRKAWLVELEALKGEVERKTARSGLPASTFHLLRSKHPRSTHARPQFFRFWRRQNDWRSATHLNQGHDKSWQSWASACHPTKIQHKYNKHQKTKIWQEKTKWLDQVSGSVGMFAFAEAAAASSSSSFSFSCKTKAVSKKVGRCQTGKKKLPKKWYQHLFSPSNFSPSPQSHALPVHRFAIGEVQGKHLSTISTDFHKDPEFFSKAAADQANQPAEDSNEGTNICIAIGIGPAMVVPAKTLWESLDRNQNLPSSLLFDLQIGKHCTRRPWANKRPKD